MLPTEASSPNTLVTIGEASKILGISTATLYRYEKQNLLVPLRTAGGHRRYSLDQLDRFKGKMGSEDFIHNRNERVAAKGGSREDV